MMAGAARPGSLWSSLDEGEALMPPAAQQKQMTVVTAAAPPKPNRTRAFHRKTKGGCITCKKRRIKCDERHPSCQKCEKASVKCLGYKPLGRTGRLAPLRPRDATPSTTTVSPPSPVGMGTKAKARKAWGADILPEPRSSTMSSAASSSSASSTAILTTVSNALPPFSLRESEVPYFDVFRFHIASQFVGFSDSRLWERAVMQEVVADEGIRQSVLAVSAMYRAFFLHPGQLKEINGVPMAAVRFDGRSLFDVHHRAAVAHHMKAMALYRRRLQTTSVPPTMRNVLVATMLFIAFEHMQGNFGGVDRLVSSGLCALQESIVMVKRKGYRSSSITLSLSCSPEAGAGASLFDTRSGSEDLEQVELLHQRMAVLSPLTSFFHPATDAPPTHINPSGAFPKPDDSFDTLFSLWKFQICQTMAFFGEAHYYTAYPDTEGLLPTVEKNRREFISRQTVWLAFLKTHLHANQDPVTRVALKLMHLHSKVSIIVLTGILDPTESAYGALTADFRMVLDGFIVQNYIALEMGVPVAATLPVICFIACKCRDRQVRMRAVDALDEVPKDGFGADLIVQSVRALVDLEEKQRDASSGLIPVQARYSWTDGTWNFHKCQLRSRFTKLAAVDDRTSAKVRTFDF
ncbi:uncharacterized protein BCR38DRAFT_98188 [Pseudomassariella vexata]|uniref:Zn(2)-C6 fungal-type domain-containing protein n=1 Tax=Pseudomassariella vexata TaxID=1141098 RepID=A0A1Y2EGX4_9PEZI|nr:uncharacterized protein BCR38DRAFT_98188 [Pseudomassariella vexata]ORY70035.1 hypothetical protein BCR38DRAFT_98188 [Pseudomassariella vexata]